MTSVDDLFRKPSSSIAAGSKRKIPAPPLPSPSSAYKSAKTSTTGSPHAPAAAAEDDEYDGDADDDVAAGPELPPETHDADEDGDGRFFGSGVSADARNALDYVDDADGEDAVAEEVIDGAWLKRLAVGFERRIARNAELRARFEGEPEKYVALGSLHTPHPPFLLFSLPEIYRSSGLYGTGTDVWSGQK